MPSKTNGPTTSPPPPSIVSFSDVAAGASSPRKLNCSTLEEILDDIANWRAVYYSSSKRYRRGMDQTVPNIVVKLKSYELAQFVS